MFMFTAIDASLVLLEMEIKVNNEMLEDVHCALESAISEALSRINNAVSKGDEELVEALTEGYTNQIEQLLGVAFVTAQVFITGVRTALNKVRKNCKQQKLNKEEMFKLESNLMQNLPEYTEIQVINAIANYWKHHEEWPTCRKTEGEFAELAWNKESKRDNEKKTIE